MAAVGTTTTSFAVLEIIETSTVIPGFTAPFGGDDSTHTSIVVLPGSRAGLTRLTRPLTGSSSPGTFNSAGLPTFKAAASDCGMCALAINFDVFITVKIG